MRPQLFPRPRRSEELGKDLGEDLGKDLKATSQGGRWTDAGVCLGIALLVLAMQYRSGAYGAALAFDPDEPAHAVSSLMVHDYLVDALGKNPVLYAQTFYSHYPKVAIGHWPPLFYVSEALWMLAAGRTRAAMLLWVAVCAAALACCLYLQVRRRTSMAAALLSVALLVHPRFFEEMLMTVHPEMLLALCVFGAAVFCGRWMESRSVRDGVLFGLCAAAALAVNGRGVVVLLLPFALLGLRPDVVRWRWMVAGAGLIAVFLAEPYFTRQTEPFSFSQALRMGVIYGQQSVLTLNPATCALVVTGMVLAWRSRVERAFWWAMVALMVCGFMVFLLLPVLWDDRYLLSTLPAAAALAGLAIHRGLLRMSRWQRGAEAAIAVGAAAILVLSVWRMEAKPVRVYGSVVRSASFRNSPVVLVDGDGITEGGIVVEACLADRGLEHRTLRGSKTIAASSWTAKSFRPLFESSADVEKYLDDGKVDLVAIQYDSSRADAELLRRTMAEHDRDWRLAATFAAPEGLNVYRRVRNLQR